MPERPNGAVLKTVVRKHPGFESLSLRSQVLPQEYGYEVDEGTPISYLALAVGTPVVASTGTQFGTVQHVLQVPELDMFDGIAVDTKHGLRFVDRDQITSITTTRVSCALSDEEAAALPPPSGSPVITPDFWREEGPTLSKKIGRLFGREHWKDVDE